MKKLAIALAALAVAATVASAAVYSQNAVGFINVEVAENEMVCLTIPFNDMASTTGTVVFKNTQMAQDAATGSTAYFWNGTGWTIANKTARGFTTTKELAPGEMFFFQPAAKQTITICGEVPDEAEMTVAIAGSGNFSAIGNPYPVETTFKTTSLADGASVGAAAYFWNGTSWTIANKTARGFTTTKVLAPGEGMFFQTHKDDPAEGSKWEVTRPFDFPAAK